MSDMAEYRSVQTRMWREDEWFADLSVEGRLLWVYLFTNPSASPAGIYRLSVNTIGNESGIDKTTVKRLLAEFSEAGKVYFEEGVIWIVNLRRLQCPALVEGSREWTVATRVQKDIDAIPDRNPLKSKYLAHSGYPIVIEYNEDGKIVKRVSIAFPETLESIPPRYPIDGVSIPHRNTDTDTDTDTDTEIAPPSGAAPRKARSRSAPKVAEDQNESSQAAMFGAVSKVCQLDAKLKTGQIAKTAKQLREAGYTVEQVQSFPAWFRSCNWKGQKGNTPSTGDLLEFMLQATTAPDPTAGQVNYPTTRNGGRSYAEILRGNHGKR